MWPDAPGDDASAYNKVFLMSDGHVTFFFLFFFKKKSRFGGYGISPFCLLLNVVINF